MLAEMIKRGRIARWGLLINIRLREYGVEPDFVWGAFVQAAAPLAVVAQNPHLHIITTVREGDDLVTYNCYKPEGIHFYVSEGNEYGEIIERLREPTPDEYARRIQDNIMALGCHFQPIFRADERQSDEPMPPGVPDYTRLEDRAEADKRIALLIKHFTTAGRHQS